MKSQTNQTLKKSLTWVQGTPMTIGAVLGSGILILPAVTANISGPAAIVAWLVMSLLSFPLSLTLGGLAAKLPHAGGIVAYARAAFGPSFGGMVGWLFLGTIPIGVPIVALIGANYLGQVTGMTHAEITMTAALLVATSVALNIRGIKISGWVQVLVITFIGVLLAISVIAAAPHVKATAFQPFAPHGWSSVGLAAVMIFWCFVGWEMIAHLAEEFKFPSRDVPLSLSLAAFVIALLYLAVAVVTIGTHAYGGDVELAPLGTLVGIGFGQMASSFTAVLALLIAFATIHTNIAGFSRMLYAQAREGDFPPFLGRIHRLYGTPVGALSTLAVFFALVLLVYFTFQPNLGAVIEWPSAIFIALYIITALAGLKLFQRGSTNWWLSAISFVMCTVIYCFSGFAMLLPALLGLTGWFITRRRYMVVSNQSEAG